MARKRQLSLPAWERKKLFLRQTNKPKGIARASGKMIS